MYVFYFINLYCNLFYLSFVPWNKIMKSWTGLKFLVVLVLYCCVMNYHKLSVLEQHSSVYASVTGSLGQRGQLVSLLRVFWGWNQDIGWASFLFGYSFYPKLTQIVGQVQFYIEIPIHWLATPQNCPRSLSGGPSLFKTSNSDCPSCRISLLL